MNKQIDERQTYLKFKPMADDLRLAESWCETDGVLNRNKTMQNLYKMGYRKQSEGEWIKKYDKAPRYVCTVCNHLYNNREYKYCPHCGAWMKGEGK